MNVINMQKQQQEFYTSSKLSSTKTYSSKISYNYNRMLVHFKNCIHDGYFNESMKRQGPGITILDNGAVMLGNFKNDQNSGMGLVFLNTDAYFIGQFNKGALDGPFVIRDASLTIYSAFTNNKIQGQLLIIDYQNSVAQLWAVESNGQGQICKQMNLSQIMNSYIAYQQIKRQESRLSAKLDKTRFISQQGAIIKQMAPYIQKIPNIAEFIKSIKSGSQEFQGMGPQIFTYKIYQENEIITLAPSNTQTNQFLAIALNKKEELISFGQFRELQHNERVSTRQKLLSCEYSYYLHGLGVLMVQNQTTDKRTKIITHEKIIYSGQFFNGQLHGQGCKSIEGDKTLYGRFVEGSIRNIDVIKMSEEKDDEIKRLELKKMKNIHIHSLKFHNNYSNERPIFIIQNLLQMMKSKSHFDIEDKY